MLTHFMSSEIDEIFHNDFGRLGLARSTFSRYNDTLIPYRFPRMMMMMMFLVVMWMMMMMMIVPGRVGNRVVSRFLHGIMMMTHGRRRCCMETTTTCHESGIGPIGDLKQMGW